MHDMSVLEQKGIPTAALVSSAFLPQARWQADKLGLIGVDSLLVGVKHPFSDQSLEQIRTKAEDVFEATLNALSNDVEIDTAIKMRTTNEAKGRDMVNEGVEHCKA